MDIVSSGLNIELDRLGAYAASSARLLTADGVCPARREQRRLRAELRTLRRRYNALREKEERDEELSGAEEWLLDNFYLARREAQSAEASLRGRGSFRSAGGDALSFALCCARAGANSRRSGCNASSTAFKASASCARASWSCSASLRAAP